MSFAKWMDLEIIILNYSEEDKYHMILHMESKKMIQTNLFTKQKQTHKQKSNLQLQKGIAECGEINQESGN